MWGGGDPMQPLAHMSAQSAVPAALPFKTIKSVADLTTALQSVRSAGRPVMLRFGASRPTLYDLMHRLAIN